MTDPTHTCPEGHVSTSADYCDTCGAPIDGAAAAAPAATPAPSPPTIPPPPDGPTKPCPNCDEPNTEASLFCEGCGYDFTTGQLPTPAAPGPPATPPSSLSLDTPIPVTWVAEMWVDAAWYEANREAATDPCPSAGLPRVVPLLGSGPLLIGRPSQSRAITPQLDCTPDSGVSRRHAQLLLDQDRWYLEDLGSTNGSFVGAGAGPVPDVPVPPGQRREISDGDRIYVGTWTRIVIRRATAGEAGS